MTIYKNQNKYDKSNVEKKIINIFMTKIQAIKK